MSIQVSKKTSIFSKYYFTKNKLKWVIFLPLILLISSQWCYGKQPAITSSITADTSKTPATDSTKGAATSKFTFLNAYNFDINSLGKANYLGHVNVYAPNMKFGKDTTHKTRFGFNSGIMKISYDSDSSSKVLGLRNITIDPRRDVDVGTKYYSQSAMIRTIISNTAYSLYFQPMYSLTDPDAINKIFIQGHFELLIFNTKSTTTYSNTKQDTLTYSKADSIRHVSVYKGDPTDTSALVSKRQSLNGYFGLGFTFDLHPWTDGSFFFQPTFGRTNSFPDFNSYLGRPGRIEKWNTFYLVRAIYTEKLSNSSKIVIGTDIRGIFPEYKPLYAIYVGLSLDMSAIAKLFKGG